MRAGEIALQDEREARARVSRSEPTLIRRVTRLEKALYREHHALSVSLLDRHGVLAEAKGFGEGFVLGMEIGRVQGAMRVLGRRVT